MFLSFSLWLRCPVGFPVIFVWFSYDCLVYFRWVSFEVSYEFARRFKDLFMVVRCFAHGFPVFLEVIPCFFYGAPLFFPKFSYGVPLALRWFSWVFLVVFLLIFVWGLFVIYLIGKVLEKNHVIIGRARGIIGEPNSPNHCSSFWGGGRWWTHPTPKNIVHEVSVLFWGWGVAGGLAPSPKSLKTLWFHSF